MRKLIFVSLLALVCLLAIGCQPQSGSPAVSPTNPILTQQSPLDVPTKTPVIEGLPEGYDPSSEEESDIVLPDSDFSDSGIAVFAGATPIPLDPVDMPTPTPRQPLAFTYATYTATKLGLTFECVAGYVVDDSQSDIYILSEPAEQQKDNYSVQFTVALSPTTASYAIGNVRTDVRAFANDLGKMNYKEWRISETAERNLMGKPGYYVTYRGVMHDDTIVRGRVHMALLDNKRLLTIHFTGPGEYNSDYTNVFYRIRETIKAI